nr:hypothetical protein [Tanacetum cinerariifolium]
VLSALRRSDNENMLSLVILILRFQHPYFMIMASVDNTSGLVPHRKESVDHPAPVVIALIAEVVVSEPAASTGSPSSAIVDQDAPSPSNSQATPEPQSSIIPNDVKDDNHDLDVAHMNNDPFFDALTQSCWIEAMQEELNEFKRLEVWELVPRPDKFMVITLKWIYNVKLDELGEVCVSQPDEFVDPNNPNHMYKLKKALYGLKQAPRIHISQSPRGIFINQSKYALESLKKYGFESCDPVDTPMVEKSKLDEDKEGKARPTKKQLHAVKRIFWYLRGTINQGLWYPKDSSIALTAFADADHAGCQDTRHSTSGSLQFLGDR